MTVSEWPKIFRAPEWWNTKVPMLLGIFCFSFLESPMRLYRFPIYLILLLVWAIVTAAFGFFLNEIFDYDQDIAAGKKNITDKLSRQSKVLIAFTLGAMSLLVWAWHPLAQFQVAFTGLQLLLFCMYSIPPFRFKEKGWTGVLFDSLYAFVIPSIIAFGAAKSNYQALFASNTIILLISWAVLAGARNILQHHVKDRKSDKIAGVKNLANVYGVDFIVRVCNSILLVELPVFAIYLFLNPGNLIIKTIFLIVYFLFNSISANRYGLRLNIRRKVGTLYFNFNSLYESWLLILATLILASSDKRFFALFIFELILFRNEVHYLFKVFYYRMVKPIPPFVKYKIAYIIWYRIIGFIWYNVIGLILYHGLVPLARGIWRFGSLTVNYSIYYYRIFVLKEDDITARRITPVVVTANKVVNTNPNEHVAVPVAGKKIKPPRDISEIKHHHDVISDDNLYINGLWIGEQLSKIELLTIKSFLRQGHRFRLWVYDPIITPLPAGVELMDANLIIDRSKIFRYKYFNKYGHGKGSVSGFSDIFRYKLLYDKGGWWVDMDVTCLRPINFETDYFFRSHHDLILVGNVMKAPKGSDLMKLCFEQASEEITEYNTDWLRPVQILNDNVYKLGLDDFVFRRFSNEDRWDKVVPMVRRNKQIPENYFLIHWMNEEWRSRGIDKNDIRFGSALGKLLIDYNLLQAPVTKLERIKADLRHVIYIPVYEYFS